jgi:mannosylglycerate hydrolase
LSNWGGRYPGECGQGREKPWFPRLLKVDFDGRTSEPGVWAAGIKLPTPDSQLLGTVALAFAVTTHAQSTLKAGVARMAKEYLTPVQCYNKIPHDAMRLNPSEAKTPLRYSFLRAVGPSVVLSTLKKAEQDSCFVLRFYNATDAEQIAAFVFGPAVNEVQTAKLNEQPVAALKVGDNQVSLRVKPNQVQTLRF